MKIEQCTFLHFSPNLCWLFPRNLVGTLPGARGTFSENMTSNELDLEKLAATFNVKKLHSCTFSGQISPKITWNYFLWCLMDFSDFLMLHVISSQLSRKLLCLYHFRSCVHHLSTIHRILQYHLGLSFCSLCSWHRSNWRNG